MNRSNFRVRLKAERFPIFYKIHVEFVRSKQACLSRNTPGEELCQLPEQTGYKFPFELVEFAAGFGGIKLLI